MILSIDADSAIPPYEQIRQQLRAMIQGGTLPAGTRLPPIRQLARDLGLAGNTVARAYRELEQEGQVLTRGRHGTLVASVDHMSRTDRWDLIAEAAEQFARQAQHQGLGVDQAIDALRDAFTRLRQAGVPLKEPEAS